MSYNNPHFDLPFRMVTVGATQQQVATVEQDTLDDVANCVLASLLTHIGQRPEALTFGSADLTFQSQPLDVQSIIQKVVHDEPRAALFINTNPAAFDELVAQVTVGVALKESS